MNKFWIVTLETFLRQVKSWSFVTLVLGPFFMFAISLGFGYISMNSNKNVDDIAVISQQSELRTAFIKSDKTDVNKDITTVSAAKKEMSKSNLAGYLVLKVDNKKISAKYYGTSALSSGIKAKVMSFINSSQQQLNFANAKLSAQQVESLQKQPVYQESIKKKTGTANTAKLISFWIVVAMVYTILVTYSSITAQEIASEKGTKIMEIIFSSTTASKYFIGKVTGVLLVIVTQILIYLIGGWGGYLYAQHSSVTKGMIEQYHTLIDAVLHNILNINLLYLLLGVVIYTILAAFTGTLVAKAEDAPKASQPVVMLSLIAFIATMPFQHNMDATAVKILSYVPFFSSYFMPLRVINNSTNALEMTISIVILLASIIILSVYISKIYQGLMLQTDDTGFWKRLKKGISYNK